VGSASQSPVHVARARAATTLLLLLSLPAIAACESFDPLSDPPVDAEVQPLEVVVNSSTRPHQPCLLNVREIRAGNHTVTVIGESGYARVRFLDQRGRVVFTTDNAGQRIETNDDGETTIIGGEAEGEGPAAHLEVGTYTVQCRPRHDIAGSVQLHVLAARPGHESSGPAQ